MAESKTAKGSLTRSPVLLGTFKVKGEDKKEASVKVYSSVTKRAITGLGLSPEEIAKGKEDKLEVRGTKGAGSIRVAKTPSDKSYSIPVPSWFKIEDMRTFVKEKVKGAESFTAPSGRVYSVGKK